MDPHDVIWDDGNRTVASRAELDQVLDRVHRELRRPTLVDVAGPGGCLTIGLGATLSILSFIPSDGLPPYLVSRNDTEDLTEHDFFKCGHHSSFPGMFMLPVATARETLLDFAESNALPESIQWQEV